MTFGALIRRGFSTATGARTRPFQVAIDGPSASGKSTTARLVAKRLGFDYIDTGAFYRCVTLSALQKGVDPSDSKNISRIAALASDAKIDLKTEFHASASTLPTTRVFLDSKDVSSDIRTSNVSKHVSVVAAIPAVRQSVVQKVRALGAEDIDSSAKESKQTATTSAPSSSRAGLVMDGRDIGTSVLTHADLKVFLVADSHVRAVRRLEELRKNGSQDALLDVKQVQEDLERRDESDRTRAVSPLRKADDAIELDTSNLTIEEQVDVIVKEALRRQGKI
ncbi:CMP/dCMP kinase [Entomortierella parvispora]|uniref:(d)CMP kinase n=1 Tax=Entomortierella parvispora TaxID=205924 RepID=A0A9P3HKP1_9FUNG|nr:CMP/dCMP kinase [Entomortierella parvispora]